MKPREGYILDSSELEGNLQRLNRMLQAAHRSSIDIKNSYDFYVLALKESNKEEIAEAYLYYDRAKYELTSAINEAKIKIKGSSFPSLRTLSYFFKLYGLYAVTFGTLSILLFSYLIYRYSDARILDVPLWAAFFAGIGSSAQILTGIVDDLRRNGMVTRYKRLWYMAIPLLSLIFGYMAYLIVSSSLIAINANSQSSTFFTMFVCFITGFLTNWLINRLSKLSNDL
ncbi:MAG: hypothetical protein A4E48_01819 [Methanosaeta sp. PtaU1.Bin060]|nr:MAG: hypothetical protein A4E48_01819 [Methanosaeta sp. PtaU1.Bin060]